MISVAKYPQVTALMIELAGRHPRRGALRDLAASTGRSAATTSRWHAGESRPDPEIWQAIADHFGVAVEVISQALEPGDSDIDLAVSERLDEMTRRLDELTRRVDQLER